MVQERLRREDSVETEKCKLLFGLFLLWELIPFSWYDLGIRGEVKIYQRLLEYIDRNLKYISDYWNISTTTQNISAIIEIYRLTDKN